MVSFLIRLLLIIVAINLLFRWLRGLLQDKKPTERTQPPPQQPEPFKRSDIIDVSYTEVPPDERSDK